MIESTLVLSLALSVMFSVGLDLDVSKLLGALDFRLPLVRGLAINLLLVPVLTVGCLSFFTLPVAPSIGILLCALCAGGSTGLLFSLHGKGDLVCSLSLFMLLNLLSLILVPIYLVFVVNFFLPAENVGGPLELLSAAILSIVWFQLLPLLAGGALRRYSLAWAKKLYPFSKKIADISLLSLFIGFAIVKSEFLVDMPLQLLLALLVVVVGTVMISLVIDSPRESFGRSVLFVTSVRNLTLALLVNDRIFGDPQITMVILTYGLFMYLLCGLLLLIGKQLKIIPAG